MNRAWIFFGLMISGIGNAAHPEQGLPDVPVIKQAVVRLGGAAPEERDAARQQLESWGKAYPRYTLQALAGIYAVETDLERRFQLEALLRDLAARWLFYQPAAFLGVNFSYVRLEDHATAIRVNNIVPGSPAEKAGLRANDLILGISGKTFEADYDAAAFAEEIRSGLPLEPLELRIRRQNLFTVEVLLQPFPMPAQETVERIQQEKQKINNWLRRLRQESDGTDSNEPVGDFRLD